MKKTGLALLVLTTFYNLSFASPLLTRSKYLISVQSEAANGAVRTGPVSYPLIYDSELSNETATDADYWIIKKQTDGTYTFQNYASKKHIKLLKYLLPVNIVLFTISKSYNSGQLG